MNEIDRIRELLQNNSIVAKKSFGQNFLINDGTIKKIVNAFSCGDDIRIIEIGPGLGSITLPLSKKHKNLIAVDADRDMIAVLKDIFKDSDVTLIESDFLRFDPDIYTDKNHRIFIGNLPYNITSELLEYILEKGFISAGVMVQKEVAEKLFYIPKKKENCPLGAFIRMQGDIEYICDVDSSCFLPAPKVQSAFIKITHQKDIPFGYYYILKALFKDPNKTISNCLKQSKDYIKCIDELKESYLSLLNSRARQLDITQLTLLCVKITEIIDKENSYEQH